MNFEYKVECSSSFSHHKKTCWWPLTQNSLVTLEKKIMLKSRFSNISCYSFLRVFDWRIVGNDTKGWERKENWSKIIKKRTEKVDASFAIMWTNFLLTFSFVVSFFSCFLLCFLFTSCLLKISQQPNMCLRLNCYTWHHEKEF